MTSQMTVGKKLFLGFGAALSLTLIVGGTAYWNFTALDKSVDQLVTVHAKSQFNAGRIAMFLSDLIGAERGIIAGAYAKDRATVEQCNRDFGEALTAWKKAIVELRPLTETAEARKILDDMQVAAESLGGMHADLYRQVQAGMLDAANAILKDKVTPSWNPVNEVADRLIEQQGGLMAAANQSTDRQVTTSIWMTVAMIVLSIVVGGVIVLVVRQINTQLRQMAVGTRRRRRAGGQCGFAGVFLKPVPGARVVRAGSFARRDIRVERGDQFHGAQKHRELARGCRPRDAVGAEVRSRPTSR